MTAKTAVNVLFFFIYIIYDMTPKSFYPTFWGHIIIGHYKDDE